MNGFQTTLIALTFVLAPGNIQAQTALDALPIPEGIYLGEPRTCQDIIDDKLDMYDFVVENEGRSFTYPEVGCVVSSAEPLSSTRFAVKGDCREFDEVWQTQFFLDVLDNGSIRIDGEPLEFCEANLIPTRSTSTETEKPDALIEEWADEDEGCRGGFGNDPRTQEACERRGALVERLEGMGWCYGSPTGGARSSFDWYQC